MPARITGTPPADTGGSPITGYRLEVSRQGGAYTTLIDDLATQDHLDAASQYGDGYRWRAKNTLGYGQPGAAGAYSAPDPGAVTHGEQINASNTGIAGAGLTAAELSVSGATTFSTAGQVVTGRRFTGTVTLAANNITLRNCQIDLEGSFAKGVLVNGTGCLIENCTIFAPTTSMYMGIHVSNGANTTIRRCSIRHCENLVTIENSGTVIEESYLYRAMNTANPSGHKDIIEVYGGNSTIIRKSYLWHDADETAVVNVAPWFGSTSVAGLDVLDNFIDGGHMHLVVDVQSTGTITNVRVLRNKMGGHTTPGVIGRYAALNNSDGRAIVGTAAAQSSNPQAILWPTTGADVNRWDQCADLVPDRTGEVVSP